MTVVLKVVLELMDCDVLEARFAQQFGRHFPSPHGAQALAALGERDGLGTQESLLDGAETRMLEEGFGGMSIDRIAACTGITKGAFFYHFESEVDPTRQHRSDVEWLFGIRVD